MVTRHLTHLRFGAKRSCHPVDGGELVPQGVQSDASEQPWLRYECSAPPATRDPVGAFPTALPTYTCNKR